MPGLDTLLGGGLDRGTSSLLIGPAGTGKSTLATRFAIAAAARGERAAIFAFDENVDTLITRSDALGFELSAHVAAGRILVKQIDPAEMGPGEFAHRAQVAVERDNATVVVIDSLNGYLNSMPEEGFLVIQMHELLSYFAQQGVTTLMVMAQSGMIGSMRQPIEVSYLADAVILFRYFEAAGHIRKAISVLKKRSGPHEDTIRELTFGAHGLEVGPPLEQFNGVLTGVPTFLGDHARLHRDG